MIRALLIDSDPYLIKNLTIQLYTYCNDIEVVGIAHNTAEAMSIIDTCRPDVVFLDSDLKDGNPLEMLRGMKERSFKVIFMTAEIPMQLQHSTDFLRKPIDAGALIRLIRKVCGKEVHQQLIPDDAYTEKDVDSSNKIAVPIRNGIKFINREDIIYLEASGNYTNIFLKNKKMLLVSKTMKSFEKILNDHVFTRIHRAYIANLYEVQEYSRCNGGELLMSNQSVLSVSKANHTKIQEMLHQISVFL